VFDNIVDVLRHFEDHTYGFFVFGDGDSDKAADALTAAAKYFFDL
jgi:hypothetical protein